MSAALKKPALKAALILALGGDDPELATSPSGVADIEAVAEKLATAIVVFVSGLPVATAGTPTAQTGTVLP